MPWGVGKAGFMADSLCSRNARPQKALVGRAQLRVSHVAPFLGSGRGQTAGRPVPARNEACKQKVLAGKRAGKRKEDRLLFYVNLMDLEVFRRCGEKSGKV